MSTNSKKSFQMINLLQNLVHYIDGKDQVCHNTQTEHVFSFFKLHNETTEYNFLSLHEQFRWFLTRQLQ
jgi:hypothetical protein